MAVPADKPVTMPAELTVAIPPLAGLLHVPVAEVSVSVVGEALHKRTGRYRPR